MSYNNVRNKSGISERRAHFGTASASDITKSIATEDLSAGSFFCELAAVPENGYSLSLNLQPCGNALETRKDFSVQRITEAKRRVPLTDVFYGADESSLAALGNASVEKGERGFRVTCNFFAKDGEAYREPGVYFTKQQAKGEYLLRIYLGTSACPKVKIYESAENICFEGKPAVLVKDGARYAQAAFTASKTVRVEITYEQESTLTETKELERIMIVDIGTAMALGASSAEAKSTFFEGESAVIESTKAIADGENEAEAFGGGRYAFKRGAGLYTVEAKSGECFLEYPYMPIDVACAIYRMGDGFIAVCENGLTVTTSDYAPGSGAKSGEIHTSTRFYIYDPEGDTAYAEGEETNLLNEYFFVRLYLGGAESGYLPENIFVDGDFCEVYDPETMERLPSGDITLEAYDDGGGKLTDRSYCHGALVKLRFKGGCAESEKIKKCRSFLFSPDGAETFTGGENAANTAVIYRGKELLVISFDGGMYATEGQILLAENPEKITAVLKYSEDFLVFSPHYIRKMTISKSGDGLAISMKNFKYDIGCDMPHSAVCTDDKIIYANSHAGIFYIDRFGFTERDMAKHVSGNVEAGENGFFACSESDLLAAEAAVCDGKYYLRVGEYFYVWDFAYAMPTGTEKASEERKLRWFMHSCEQCRKILGADEENVYFIDDNGGFISLVRGSSLDSDAESYFRSKSYSLAPFGGARPWKLSLSLAAKEACTVRLYFDGEEGNSKYTILPNGNESSLFIVRPEARACRKFAFSLHSFGAIRLDGFKIEYLPK